MTLHATREGDQITVHATYGTAVFRITEHAGHIGHFWSQLGNLLRDEEKPWLKTEPVPGLEIDTEGLARVMLEGIGDEPVRPSAPGTSE